MKKIILKPTIWVARKVARNENKIMPTLMVMFVLIAAFGHKKEMRADDGSAGRGFFGGALTGAAIGGIAGGGRGAGIGALAGGVLGAGIGASRSSGRDPYRKLDKLESKLNNLQDKAAKYRDDVTSATTDRRRQRAEKRLSKVQRDIENMQRQITNMKQNLGVRQQPPRGGYGYNN